MTFRTHANTAQAEITTQTSSRIKTAFNVHIHPLITFLRSTFISPSTCPFCLLIEISSDDIVPLTLFYKHVKMFLFCPEVFVL